MNGLPGRAAVCRKTAMPRFAAKKAGRMTATQAMPAPARAKRKDAGTVVNGRKSPPDTDSKVEVLPSRETEPLAVNGAARAAARARQAASAAGRATTWPTVAPRLRSIATSSARRFAPSGGAREEEEDGVAA